MLLIASTFFSCASYKESVVLGDVIGFSDDIQQSYKSRKHRAPYDISDDQGKAEMDEFILNIPAGQNSKVEQQVEDFGYYTTNSEYNSQAESRFKTYVIMVIDGSKSFEQNSELAKQKAIEMRDVITERGNIAIY